MADTTRIICSIKFALLAALIFVFGYLAGSSDYKAYCDWKAGTGMNASVLDAPDFSDPSDLFNMTIPAYK